MNAEGGRPSAVVVGAGFSGLVTAYALERAGYAVEVYERAARAGGLLQTTVTEYGLVESGANAFLNSARVEALFADLELALVPARRESRARFIFRDGLPRRWPIGLGGTLRLFYFLLRFVFARAAVSPKPGESLAAWGNRTLGADATEYLILPAFQGIYAGEGRRLSATLLLGSVFRSRKGPKARILGSVSAPGGMGEVVTKLQAKLESRGVRFHFATEVPSVPSAARVYYCGSAAESASSLTRVSPELARLLARIEMLPLVSVTAFFPPDARVRPGFGVLFPPSESFRSLGVLYNQVIFPGRVASPGTLSETWILGGARRPAVTGLDDAAILSEILADRGRLLGFAAPSEAPLSFVIRRWPKGIPYYTVELESILAEINRRNSESTQVRLMGNYLGGIGLAKILDRVADEVEKVET